MTRDAFAGANLDEGRFLALIHDHIAYIEKRCAVAIDNLCASYSPLMRENRSLELFNRIIDRLKNEDFKILRQFQGKSKLTTYLTTVIAHQAVDLIRHQQGRDRQKERVAKMGSTAFFIWKRMKNGQNSPALIQKELKESTGITLDEDEIYQMMEKIRQSSSAPEGKVIYMESNRQDDDKQEWLDTYVSDKNNPENLMIEDQRQSEIKEAIKVLFDGLDGEERMILKMRFAPDDERMKFPVEQLAMMLGISQKTVYKRVYQVVKKCRQILQKKGIHVEELWKI